MAMGEKLRKGKKVWDIPTGDGNYKFLRRKMHRPLTVVVCAALSGGAAAVFGPMSSTSSTHLRSLCAAVQLPHFEARNDDDDPDPHCARHKYTVNLFPYHAALSRALVDFVRHLHWTSVTLLYVNDDGIKRLPV